MLLPMKTYSLASEIVGPILRAISQDVPDLETELLHLCHLRTLRLPGSPPLVKPHLRMCLRLGNESTYPNEYIKSDGNG